MRILPFQPGYLKFLDPPLPVQMVGYGRELAELGPAWAGWEDDRLLGVTGIRPAAVPDTGEAWAFFSVMTRRERFDIAMAFARRIEEEVTGAGFRRIVATVQEGMPLAERWMAHLRFARRELLPNYLGTGRNFWCWERVFE